MDQIIATASDILLGAGAFGAAIYCGVLARRLKKFNNLENGVGGAVAVLSAQVDDMTRTLDRARRAAGHSSATLTSLTERAEDSARKLEIMMASLHDLPDAPTRESGPLGGPEEGAQDALWEAAAKGGAAKVDAPSADAQPLFSTQRARAAK